MEKINKLVEKKDIPICHGEEMQPVERYKEDGRVIIRYQCGMCHCSETVDVMVKTSEEKKEIRDSIDLFNYMWKQRGDDP